MTMTAASMPDLAELEAGLAALLTPNGGEVGVVDRAILDEGTLPKEVVRVHAAGGRHEVLCKHGGPENAGAVRRGTAFEADVYRAVVEPTGLTSAPLVGAFQRADRGTTLVLSHLPDAVRLSEAPVADMVPAARWLGLFHARWSDTLPALPSLGRADARDLRYWAERASRFSRALPERHAWVKPLCDTVMARADTIAPAPSTVVHGEFTVHNVLSVEGRIHPVDWESTAIGPGELDLVMLLERWPEDIRDACIEAYREARWPAGGDHGFWHRLRVATLWVSLRWLGERPSFAAREDLQWRYDQLREAAEAGGVQ